MVQWLLPWVNLEFYPEGKQKSLNKLKKKESESKYKSVKIRLFFLCSSVEGKQSIARICIQRGKRGGRGEFPPHGCPGGIRQPRGWLSIKGMQTHPWAVEKNRTGEVMTRLSSWTKIPQASVDFTLGREKEKGMFIFAVWPKHLLDSKST